MVLTFTVTISPASNFGVPSTSTSIGIWGSISLIAPVGVATSNGVAALFVVEGPVAVEGPAMDGPGAGTVFEAVAGLGDPAVTGELLGDCGLVAADEPIGASPV